MIFSIVSRYLIKELIKPLFFCIFGFTLVMISGFLFEFADLLIIKKVPFLVVCELLIYKFPALLVETFPIALLFASIYSLSRLIQDNEITAMRTGGISLSYILLPFLLIALLFSITAYYINEEVVPWTNHRSKNIIRKTILKQTVSGVQEDVFFKGPRGRYFYVQRVLSDESEIQNILVYETGERLNRKQNNFPRIITAKKGYYRDKVWTLLDGIIHELTTEGELQHSAHFERLELQVEYDPVNFYGQQRTPSEMSREELVKEIQLFQKSGLNVASLVVEYHLKLAFPFASLIFVLIGAPLSLSLRRGKSFGIAMAIVILFAYQIGLSISRSLGKNLLLPPLLAAWLPNVIFGLIGVFLLLGEEYARNLKIFNLIKK